MKNKKIIILFVLICIIAIGFWFIINNDYKFWKKIDNTANIKNINGIEDNAKYNEINNTNSDECVQYINSVKDVELQDVDGKSKKYSFKYNNEIYTAVYTTDNWHINDSYKITSEHDMTLICQALINEHEVHGRDMVSYRTAEDMAYEWLQHNLAYEFLPEESSWKNNAKDVDLNPADQGRDLIEMFDARTNNEKTSQKITE